MNKQGEMDHCVGNFLYVKTILFCAVNRPCLSALRARVTADRQALRDEEVLEPSWVPEMGAQETKVRAKGGVCRL